MTLSALLVVLAVWLGFLLFLIGILLIGNLAAWHGSNRSANEHYDPLERVWMLPPAERHNDREAA